MRWMRRLSIAVGLGLGPAATLLLHGCTGLKSAEDRPEAASPVADAGADTSETSDGRATAPLSCKVSQSDLVDDLSAQAAGQRQFIPGVWVSTTANADQIFVLTQGSSSASVPVATTTDSGSATPSGSILAYEVDFKNRTALATGFGPGDPNPPGSVAPGLSLLDVEPGSNGSLALLANGS